MSHPRARLGSAQAVKSARRLTLCLYLFTLFHATAATKSSNPNLTPNPPPSNTHSTHVSATTQLRPLYKFDTAQIQITFPQIRGVSNAPICVSTPIHPTFPLPSTTKSASTVQPPESPPMRLNRQLRPSYDHETNETPLRYETNRYSYEERLTPYLARDCAQPGFPPHRHQPKVRNTTTRPPTIVSAHSEGALPRMSPHRAPANNRGSLRW